MCTEPFLYASLKIEGPAKTPDPKRHFLFQPRIDTVINPPLQSPVLEKFEVKRFSVRLIVVDVKDLAVFIQRVEGV